jgi:hypothetical protein
MGARAVSTRRVWPVELQGAEFMRRRMKVIFTVLSALAAVIAGVGATDTWAAKKQLSIARVYWEYNASANDLGVHVFLDGEDWRELAIVNPQGRVIFEVEGKGPYQNLGMTELFFEGAEPSLAEVPLAELLSLFPEGKYRFTGRTVEGDVISGMSAFTHAIPDGPSNLSAALGLDNSLVIGWDEVTAPPAGFPDRPLHIVAYQVIVEKFQVTVPGTVFSVTVPPEYVQTLSPGAHLFEVLAIEAGGNQTLTK